MNAIVFDLDGTLIQLESDYPAILERTFREVVGRVEQAWLDAYQERFVVEFTDLKPDPVETAFRACGAPGDPDVLAETLLEHEIEASVTHSTVHEDLERLAEDHRLAVLTNGVPEWQGSKLAAHGLDDHFDLVLASYAVGAHKPNPEPFEAVERRLPAERYAIIGDSDSDIEGGSAAGWATVEYRGDGFGDLPTAIDWNE